mgnify:CR=1 FL=1
MPDDNARLLRIRDVIERVGLSRSTIYRLAKRGAFPAPRHPAGVAVAVWSAAEVNSWISDQVNRAAGA